MNKKNLILFMPSIEIGGVEKNFLIISNYFSKKFKKVTVITTSVDSKKNLHIILTLFHMIKLI